MADKFGKFLYFESLTPSQAQEVFIAIWCLESEKTLLKQQSIMWYLMYLILSVTQVGISGRSGLFLLVVFALI